MKTYSIALGAIIVLGSFSFVGCTTDREVAFRDTDIQELQRVNKELENQLQACIDQKSVKYIGEHQGESPEATGRALIPGAILNSRPTDLIISIENNILFKPGSADLSVKARTTLLQVVSLLKNKYADGYYVRVDGFTDDQKISRSKDKWDDNWDLSGGRSQAVLHFLLEHGVPAHELGFAGFGMERPLEPNTSESNRAHNRRVEIVVIPRNGETSVPNDGPIEPHHEHSKKKAPPVNSDDSSK